ncbi:peptide deformylase [Undibacterium cyanobacteriorum]|uniref:Peptide deformylase n=1 Tax=Undibacterium cyanobacteriorum TaxID=3073561 RepID=A0ABY9RLM7_9BURK|nr:peptide deformylase [Undibacterium sp. 20NA77.5]WMW81585.1 peptide deformylase [Undibacterium sp. 20NA77.5]
MSLPKVLPSDDPRLKQVAASVVDVFTPEFQEQSRNLKACLDAFRLQHGFGRGIAAPQIGMPLRFIALNLGTGSFCMINPEIVWHSEVRFTMWDDCMCFPDTLVKVQRYVSISVRFLDESGQVQEWHQLKRDLAELLQHEIDHLDGVLALDLAVDQDAMVSRQEFESRRAFFEAQVDYVIHPTT